MFLIKVFALLYLFLVFVHWILRSHSEALVFQRLWECNIPCKISLFIWQELSISLCAFKKFLAGWCWRDGSVIKCFRTHTALARDLSWVPSIQVWKLITTCHFSFNRIQCKLWPPALTPTAALLGGWMAFAGLAKHQAEISQWALRPTASGLPWSLVGARIL